MTKVNPNEPNEPPEALLWWQYPLEYITLLQRNPRYRLYLLSHACQHMGDWYIRIASLLALDRLAPDSATAISVLVIVKAVPHAILPHMGGALADSIDRRKVMIALDVLGALVTLGFIIAIQTNSLPGFYAVVALRATVHSLYEPSTKSIVPMIVSDHQDLKRAMTVNGIVWAFMVTIGGIVAGRTSAYLGVQACFAFDSFTFVLSAFVLLFLRGNYTVRNEGPTLTQDSSNTHHTTVRGQLLRLFRPVVAFFQMTKAVIVYLYKSGFGLVVFLKSCGSLIWGPSDVLNVEFAHVPNDEDATSERLGLLFSCIGIGCLLGPMCANAFTERPVSMQLVCVGAMVIMMCGWIGISQTTQNFAAVCVFTAIRAFGSSIVWVNSSLLLQRLSVPEMLGRVLALEFASCMFFDAVIATLTGRLLDTGIASKHDIASCAAAMAGTMCFFWSVYHMFGKGAARKKFNQPLEVPGSEKMAQVVFA